MTARLIIQKYLSFFEKRGHTQIANASLVPENDPTTLFTSSGMQPLVPYLLGEAHPQGKRLVNVQNCFRAQDIEEIGNNQIPKDTESIRIWQNLFKEKGIDAKLNERIFLYDDKKNWWSRSGTPDKMPVGELGGTDSEV